MTSKRVLPASILRDLTAEEMAEYRRPFLEPGEARRPTLTWPREIPLEGEPDPAPFSCQFNFECGDERICIDGARSIASQRRIKTRMNITSR